MLPLDQAQVLWDYLCLHQSIVPTDCIIGFGCYNLDIPRRAAELYHRGYAPRILFTGALGRNTRLMWQDSEAVRFARIAMDCGVPEEAILIEDRATNTAENIQFARELLEQKGISVQSILGVHKPYMERRIAAAWPVYWPQMPFRVTSFQQTMEEYLAAIGRHGRTPEATIHMLAGDFQRMTVYAQKGYQIPQEIPESVQDAFDALVEMGYTDQLVKYAGFYGKQKPVPQ